MSKGGAIRKKIAAVDQESLNSVFDEAAKKFGQKAFDLGSYNEMKPTQAVNGDGLVHNSWWLRRLVLLGDELLPLQIKQAIIGHATKHNKKSLKDPAWASEMAGQFVCLLHHWRRLKRDPNRKRQCMLKLSDFAKTRLEELLQLQPEACDKAQPVDSKTDQKIVQPVACNKAKSGSSNDVADPEDGNVCKEGNETHEQDKEAWEKASASSFLEEVSLDSQGFPMMLRSPAEGPIRTKKGASHRSTLEKEALVASEALAAKTPEKQVRSKAKKKKGQGHEKKPKAKKPSVSAKAGSKKKPSAAGFGVSKNTGTGSEGESLESKAESSKAHTQKRPAAAVSEVAKSQKTASKGKRLERKPEISKPFERIKKTIAKKQSYLQAWSSEEKKWKLLVACSQTQAQDHASIINQLEERVWEPGMTKDKLVSLRNKMLEDEEA